MRILSYNVNGLRAAVGKGLFDWIKTDMPDVLCIQEIKLQDNQVSGLMSGLPGYRLYLHAAQKKGYSGVAMLVREKPDQIHLGMGNDVYDREGRVIRADYGDISLINVYVPSGTMGGSRQDFKMRFLADFQSHILNLKNSRGKMVVSGDFNICHEPIDINHPEKHKKSSGFLPEEREWMDGFLRSGFLDSFREFNNQPEQYSWWSYRAGSRKKNLGWRIDYHMVTPSLRDKLVHAGILNHVNHSDHCPVMIELAGC